MNEIIQGLWIGPELSLLEQLSVSSFLRNGHQYHLYVYDDVKNVPAGVVIKDGNEILPASKIFQYKQQASYSGFSNFFRYKLLLERGGWWVDIDTVCLRPFDFSEEYAFSSETAMGQEFINSGICKAPAGSEAMAFAWGVCEKKDPDKLVWGETGPRLIAAAVQKFSLERYKQSPEVFVRLVMLTGGRYWNPKQILNSASAPMLFISGTKGGARPARTRTLRIRSIVFTSNSSDGT